jgi:hypothetical protein
MGAADQFSVATKVLPFIIHWRKGGICKTPDFDFLIVNVLMLTLPI